MKNEEVASRIKQNPSTLIYFTNLLSNIQCPIKCIPDTAILPLHAVRSLLSKFTSLSEKKIFYKQKELFE
jgi:hypothetical protein